MRSSSSRFIIIIIIIIIMTITTIVSSSSSSSSDPTAEHPCSTRNVSYNRGPVFDKDGIHEVCGTSHVRNICVVGGEEVEEVEEAGVFVTRPSWAVKSYFLCVCYKGGVRGSVLPFHPCRFLSTTPQGLTVLEESREEPPLSG